MTTITEIQQLELHYQMKAGQSSLAHPCAHTTAKAHYMPKSTSASKAKHLTY